RISADFIGVRYDTYINIMTVFLQYFCDDETVTAIIAAADKYAECLVVKVFHDVFCRDPAGIFHQDFPVDSYIFDCIFINGPHLFTCDDSHAHPPHSVSNKPLEVSWSIAQGVSFYDSLKIFSISLPFANSSIILSI